MISGRQIRAARALLSWDAKELASKTGLSIDTIFKIETGAVQARLNTIERIKAVFESQGLEFTKNHGVDFRPTNVNVYEGREQFNRFYDFLYDHLKDRGGDVCLSITDERLLAKYRKNPKIHYERMQDLFNKGIIKSFRILAGKSHFATNYSYNTYKWHPNENLAPTAFYTFGDCLALISFVHENPPYVVVIQSAPLVKAYQQAFESAWASAKDPKFLKNDKPKTSRKHR